MIPTSYPTPLSHEIELLESEIKSHFDTGEPIDPKRVQRLCDLRVERLQELAEEHARILGDRKKREEIMQSRTREMMSKIPCFTSGQIKLNASVIERLEIAQEDYGFAAERWVNEEISPWEESEAYKIAAGILVIASEIC
jgi:hypothetical protein